MKLNSMLVISLLLIAVVGLGYLYYDRTRNDVTIQLPTIDMKP